MAQLLSRELVGRADVLAGISDALHSAGAGCGGALALAGEPGIGKTRLRKEAERQAAGLGMAVMTGRGLPGGNAEAFQPLREALTAGFRRGGWPAGALRGPARVLFDPAGPLGSVGQVSRLALAEGVLGLVEVVARDRGMLLVIEDLHWADDDTVAVTEYLAEHADVHGALCLLTLRPETGSQAYRVVRRLADTRALRLLQLGPLGREDMDKVVLSCLEQEAAPAELLDFVRRHADGVPFLAEELLAGLVRCGALVGTDAGWQVVGTRLRSTVPQTLADSVTRRVQGLDPGTRQVLFAAAFAGPGVDCGLIGQMTGLDDDTVLASLRESADGQLLTAEGSELRFRHALTRDQVVALMLPPERAALAGRAVVAVERAHPGLPGEWCDLAAELAQLAGDEDRAARYLLEAAGRALGCGALDTATARLELLRQITAGRSGAAAAGEVMMAQARALAGDVGGALVLATSALRTLRERGDDPRGEIDLELSLGRAFLGAGRHDEARQHCDRAHASALALGEHRRRLRTVILAAQVDLAAGHPEAASRRAADVLGQVGSALPEVRCEALEIVGRAARLHDIAAAQRAFEEALTVAGRHGLAVWRARALHELGTIDLLDSMRTDRLEAARRAAIETGVPATAAVADFHLGEALVARGHAEAGRAAAERAAALAYRLGSSVYAPALLTVARSYAHQRRTAQMEQALARAAEAAPGDVAIEAGQWGRVRAMLALHNGDADGARAALDRAVELLRAVPGHHFPHWGLWALLHSADIDGKGAAARSAAAGADGSGTRFNRALLRAAHAVAERSADGVAEATTDLRGYVDSDWLVHLMSWLIAPAAIRDGWGEPVSWLQAAVRWFADHGYAPLATSCRTLLRDAGGLIPRRAPGGAPVPDQLRSRGVSSREADVLRLLGVRMSNREIAAELVLSPRTVEKHVASLLRKTGAPGRAALAALAATLPPA